MISTNIRLLAKLTANELLIRTGISHELSETGTRCVPFTPVLTLCKVLGISIAQSAALRSKAEITSTSDLIEGRMWAANVRTDLTHTERRFTIAHEIGHWCISNLALAVDKTFHELFCDEFASELLLPAVVLESWVRHTRAKSQLLTLDAVLEGARRARVGHLLFVRQLMHELKHQELDPNGLALVAWLGGSKSARQLLGLRIRSAAPPKDSFLAVNRRLKSIGLEDIEVNFGAMSHFERRRYAGTILISIQQPKWRTMTFPCSLDYVKFGIAPRRQYLILAGSVFR